MGKIFAVNFPCYQATSEGGITEAARFLTNKANNFYGTLQDNFLFLQGSDCLQSGNDAHSSIEFSAVDNRVQMRTSQERRRFCLMAGKSAENIADAVDVDLQTDLPHLVNEKLAAAQLFD